MSRNKKRYKIKDIIGMYDMMIGNFVARKQIIAPRTNFDSSKVHVGYSLLSSSSQISKMFIIKNMPLYVKKKLFDEIRRRCLISGLKINYYIYCNPHRIPWESSEMRNKMQIWSKSTQDGAKKIDAFNYTESKQQIESRQKIIDSTLYFNKADLEQKRSIWKTYMAVEFVCRNNDDGVADMSKAITTFKNMCSEDGIAIKEMRVNMVDWLKTVEPFSLKNIREIDKTIPKKTVTDDILCQFDSYKQGIVGNTGICIGIDVHSLRMVMHKLKEDDNKAENWLISAITGAGKSYFVKNMAVNLLGEGLYGTIFDYEGDEYLRLAAYLKAGNPDFVKVISMGKDSMLYFEPMEIGDITGDKDIDSGLKTEAIAYTEAMFRVMVAGLEGNLSRTESRIISSGIKSAFDRAGVTDDKETWKKSRGLRLEDVYRAIKKMVESRELVDEYSGNKAHKAAVSILEASSVFFEEGEAKYGTFSNPISINDIYTSNLLIFSFGMKGADTTQVDPILLALKQLSVSKIAISRSNYCKYVLKICNFKIWEEYQRYGTIKGSEEIIVNAMTGGRKRGDINLLVTNDLSEILDIDNKVAQKIRQNITTKVLGKIASTKIIDTFCREYNCEQIKADMVRIKDAPKSGGKTKAKDRFSNKYEFAFCCMLDNGKTPVVKVALPDSLHESGIYTTGVA